MNLVDEIKWIIFEVSEMQVTEMNASLSGMGIDSLMLIEIIVRLESLTGMKVPLEMLVLNNFDTIEKMMEVFSDK